MLEFTLLLFPCDDILFMIQNKENMAMIRFNVASWNLMCPVPEPLRFIGQKQRMEHLAGALITDIDGKVCHLDALAVQESIVNSYTDILTHGLYQCGFEYRTDPLSGKRFDKIVLGGVYIYSRYPIISHSSHIFQKECASEDCMAAKGCTYACIEKDNECFHVIATHLQAWNTEETRRIRQQQIIEIGEFITNLKLDKTSRIIVLGDFNTDLYVSGDMIEFIEDTLGVQRVEENHNEQQSHPFSSDPATNRMMGSDDDTPYSSACYKKGCYQDYVRMLRCYCCPQELLDHGFINRQCNTYVAQQSWSAIVPVKSNHPFTIYLSAKQRLAKIRDISDHYPVILHLVFNRKHLHSLPLPLPHPHPHPLPLPISTSLSPPLDVRLRRIVRSDTYRLYSGHNDKELSIFDFVRLFMMACLLLFTLFLIGYFLL